MRRFHPLRPTYASPIALSPDGTRVLAVENDQVVAFDLTSGNRWVTDTRSRHSRMLWSPDGRSFWTSDRATVRRHAAADAGTIAMLSPANVCSLACSEDGTSLALGDVSGQVTVIDTRTNAVTASVPVHSAFVNALHFVPSERRLLTCGWNDGAMSVLDSDTGDPLLRVVPAAFAMQCADLSRDGRIYAIGGTEDNRTGVVFVVHVPGPDQPERPR